MLSTRQRFQAAIDQSSTSVAAAGIIVAIHQAQLKDLFDELQENDAPSGYFIDEEQFRKLKAEYTTV